MARGISTRLMTVAWVREVIGVGIGRPSKSNFSMPGDTASCGLSMVDRKGCRTPF